MWHEPFDVSSFLNCELESLSTVLSKFMIHILECDHAFQVDRQDQLQSPEIAQVLARQREFFAAKINRILDAHPNICLVGEETRQGEDTFARRAATRRNIQYVNIDMTRQARLEAGIPEEYSDLPEDQATPLHRIRERHFFEQVQRHNYPEANAPVICGRLHARPLEDLVRNTGHQVQLVQLTPQEGFNWEWSVP